jgi:hypothetical protein
MLKNRNILILYLLHSDGLFFLKKNSIRTDQHLHPIFPFKRGMMQRNGYNRTSLTPCSLAGATQVQLGFLIKPQEETTMATWQGQTAKAYVAPEL